MRKTYKNFIFLTLLILVFNCSLFPQYRTIRSYKTGLRPSCHPYPTLCHRCVAPPIVVYYPVFLQQNDRRIREYRSADSSEFIRSFQNYGSLNRNENNYDARLSSIERRIESLENSITEIKNNLENIHIGSFMSDEKYQRLLKVEKDVENLKGLLLEVREYLKTRR